MDAAGQPATREDRRRLRRLRRTCESRLAELDVPAGSTVTDLCAQVAARRGRPIHLVPMAMPATHPCGFWVATEEADFILYEANTSRTHQEHIVVHELAHMICCHRGNVPLDEVSARILFPDVDPALVQDMLRRAAYTDEQEREAEVMASVVLEQFARRPDPLPGAAFGEATETLARIGSSLTYRRSRSG